MIKIQMGGSPCTHWSVAKKDGRETEASGIGWELFKNYLIALQKYKPDYFLYENVKSMSNEIKEQISYELGCEPILINSALVSAQNRQRYYWTNIPGIEQPKDRGILLRDVLETGTDLTHNEKSYVLTASYNGACAWNTIERSQRTMIAEPVILQKPHGYNSGGVKYDKSPTLTANGSYQDNNHVLEPVRVGTYPRPDGVQRGGQGYGIYDTSGKSATVTANGGGLGKYSGLYAEPVEISGEYFKGGFGNEQKPNLIGKIVCDNTSNNNGQPAQGTRIYSPNGKSICLDADSRKYIITRADGKSYPVYEVKNGYITIKDKQYKIKLADGFYIIRKLTVLECMRLQTVPEWYQMPCSATQNYKMLGNGWTIEVIKHILSYIPNILNEDIEVLSMYDGMSCGQIALKEMGCNVVRYYASEIDKYAIQTTMANFPNTIQLGDAFQVREADWSLEKIERAC